MKVRTLDALQDNLTAEILTLYRKSTLQRWLQSYGYDAEKENVLALVDNGDDKDLLINLGAALGVEVPDDIADYLLEQRDAVAVAAAPAGTPAVKQTTEPAAASTNVEEAPSAVAEAQSEAASKPHGFDAWEDAEKAAFLSRQDIDSQWQEELIREGEPAVRQALARNPSLEERWHVFLCETGSKEIKTALAENPSIDVEVQQLLAKDNWEVRRALAANRSLTSLLHETLGNDKDGDVKAAFLTNPSLPEALQKAKYDAAIPSKMPFKYAIDQERAATALVVALASNVSLGLALQELFTGDLHFGVSTSKVRTSLASNPVIGEKIQARLLATKEEVVLRALASNPSLAVVGQHELRANGSIEARVLLSQNPSVASSVREKLFQLLTKDDLSTLESRLSSARRTYERRWDDEIAAMKKASDYGYDGIFWSEEKRAKLDRDAEFATKDKWEAWNETVDCESFVNGLKKLLAEKEGVNA
ncbi:hypothetical protein [Paraburkholderia sacchari]|nr:hypothetical protein [Paraburkholderia sacchari]